MHSRTATRIWERVWYALAIVVAIATLANIYFDRDEILAYYSAKKASGQSIGFASVLDGDGTADFPYLISSLEDWEVIRKNVQKGYSTSGLYFKLMTDIDLNPETGWKSIGTLQHPLNGVFDGNGHSIRNLTISGKHNSFFGVVNNCRIQNFSFENIAMQGKNNAVLVNYSAGRGNYYIINCLVSDVKLKSDSQEQNSNAVFANNLTNGLIAHCYATDISDLLTVVMRGTRGTSLVQDCVFTNVTIARNSIGIERIGNSRTLTQNALTFSDACLETLADFGVAGTFLEWEKDTEGNISFTSDEVNLYSAEGMIEFKDFISWMLKNLLVIFSISLFCVFLSKWCRLSVGKCVFYGIMAYTFVFMLFEGFITNGQAIIPIFYDARTNGRLRVFTDFFDCITPGIDPYTKTITPYSSIYPPFISLPFYLLSGFIPQKELTSSITARDSQMGSVIFLICMAILIVLMYMLVQKYKRGNKGEKLVFFLFLCVSFPFIYCMERGNIVLLAALLLITFLYNYNSTCYWKRQIAYLALSAVVGIKLYPVVFGFLLFKNRRIKDVINCVVYGLVINLLPSIVFPTRFSSIAYMFINATEHMKNTMFVGGKMDLSHLLIIPRIIFQWSDTTTTIIYKVLTFIGIDLTVLIIFLGNMKPWKNFTLVILGMLLFESFSPPYYSLYFIAPLMMFLDSDFSRKGLGNVLYALLFIGIFAFFVSPNRYPLDVFFPSQSIIYTTLIQGFFWIVFECVLLAEGLISCGKRLFVTGKVAK